MRKTLSSLVAVALAAAAFAAPSFAQTPAAPAASISHADVFKALGSGPDDKVKEQLIGKTYEGKLIRTSPTSLMANIADGVYFTCESSPAAYKGGAVKSTIKSYETLPSGESLVGLTSCAPT